MFSNIERETPVLTAASFGHCASLRLLLDNGGDAYRVDSDGSDAYACAKESGCVSCIEILYRLHTPKSGEQNLQKTKSFFASPILQSRGSDAAYFADLFNVQPCDLDTDVKLCDVRSSNSNTNDYFFYQMSGSSLIDSAQVQSKRIDVCNDISDGDSQEFVTVSELSGNNSFLCSQCTDCVEILPSVHRSNGTPDRMKSYEQRLCKESASVDSCTSLWTESCISNALGKTTSPMNEKNLSSCEYNDSSNVQSITDSSAKHQHKQSCVKPPESLYISSVTFNSESDPFSLKSADARDLSLSRSDASSLFCSKVDTKQRKKSEIRDDLDSLSLLYCNSDSDVDSLKQSVCGVSLNSWLKDDSDACESDERSLSKTSSVVFQLTASTTHSHMNLMSVSKCKNSVSHNYSSSSMLSGPKCSENTFHHEKLPSSWTKSLYLA